MQLRACAPALVAVLLCPNPLLAQNWSFDAQSIALGGVGGSGNLATSMIDEQRDYRSIVIPIGLFQVLGDRDKFDPNSSKFDPVRAAEDAASPLHYVIGRDNSAANAGQAAFINDIRNATLSRDLNKYRGFVPANSLVGEGLAAPNFGGTIKFHKDANGGFQGIYIGGGPYLSMHAAATIDQGLTNLLANGGTFPNARFPITNNDEAQIALAITGGYRGRFGWPMGIGSGTSREGLYVAANYNYLRGFQYENFDMTIRLDTDSTGLITLKPTTTPIVVSQREASKGSGFAIDLGVGAVIDNWEIGFGANGLSNRIDWTALKQTTYSLDNLLSGNSDFKQSTTIAAADTQVVLPVDYRASLAYTTDQWSFGIEGGHGFGGASFHGGLERRFGPTEVRGGAFLSSEKWNPTGGIGFDVSRHVSFDFAAFGSNANIQRKRRMAIAASIRFNHLMN